ncbi:hypothetical protein ALP47_200054 [Pseudomonas savastanoi]|nr:hypothetical protein ALP47_200054 [Pseudomonas savastanoi]
MPARYMLQTLQTLTTLQMPRCRMILRGCHAKPASTVIQNRRAQIGHVDSRAHPPAGEVVLLQKVWSTYVVYP